MKLKYFLLAAVAMVTVACSEDDLESESIFHDHAVVEQNDFDRWLKVNYVDSFNIMFKYKFEFKESDKDYNLAPADYDKAVALAKLTKYMWLESYKSVMGLDFIRTYCPKVMHLVGSPAYNEDGSIVLGTAEGGMKITLYNVNNLDLDKLDLELLNRWYFHTMHHEFAHILHQTKNYPTEFNEVTKDSYQSNSWVNLKDSVTAWQMGYITPYASMETQEDFVEILSTYITSTQAYWDYVLERADPSWLDKSGHALMEEYASFTVGVNGKQAITQKLEIVREWLKTAWGVDIDDLRAEVLYRSQHFRELDLKDISIKEDK